jgi:hypothetical protein
VFPCAINHKKKKKNHVSEIKRLAQFIKIQNSKIHILIQLFRHDNVIGIRYSSGHSYTIYLLTVNKYNCNSMEG